MKNNKRVVCQSESFYMMEMKLMNTTTIKTSRVNRKDRGESLFGSSGSGSGGEVGSAVETGAAAWIATTPRWTEGTL